MDKFSADDSVETNLRSIYLLGANTATYKFALTKSLLDLKGTNSTLTEQTSVFNGWVQHRKQHATTQSTLISELSALGNVQIQLVEKLKTYQSTITPPDYLKSDTTQLESDTVKLEDGLSELVNAQIKIEQSQTKITGSQTEIQAELKELNRLLDK